jgi:hypothetical protein
MFVDDKVIFAVSSPSSHKTRLGILGGISSSGVIALEAEEDEEVPIAFVAVTVKVYSMPFVSPVTVIGEDAPVPVRLPGDEVTV